MSDIDRLLKQQQDALYLVHRSLDNFKKIGKSNYTIANTRNRIAKLEDAFKESQRLHRQIVSIATAEQQKTLSYFSEQLFLTAHDAYLATSDYMAEILNQLDEKRKSNVPPGSSSEPDMKTVPPIGTSTWERLPQLHLPTFSGDLGAWESFRDRFHAMIVENSHLSKVSKLQYLLSCVSSEPLDMIRNLAITDANFQIAWDTLTRRYENKRRLITAHVQSLLNLPRAATESQTALSEVRDRANMALQALKNLECAVDSWDELIVCLMVNCLDKNTRRAWELQLGNSTDFPNYADLDTFLETRIRSLESIASSRPAPVGNQLGSSNQRSTHSRSSAPSHATTSYAPRCPLCQASHGLNQCPAFRAKTAAQRFDYVKQGKRCINCFSSQHVQRDCKSNFSCQKCRKRHHTLLHFSNAAPTHVAEASPARPISPSNQPSLDSQPPATSLSVMTSTVFVSRVLLATAWVEVHSASGNVQRVRALLDQGSVVSLITENLAQRLKAPRARVSISITGVGNRDTLCKTSTTLQIVSCKRSGAAYSTTALIVANLSTYVPPRVSGNFNLPHLRGLTFADDNPFSSDPIEMIVGADVYGLILQDGVRKGADNEPVAQETTLGWILSGPIPTTSNVKPLPFRLPTHHCTTLEDLDSAIRQFWEIEHLSDHSSVTLEDQDCEQHFVQTHTRTSSGRYCVRLPFIRGPPIDIGMSFSAAKLMWLRQENRLQANPRLAAEYAKFMREYEALQHMTEIRELDTISSQHVYIPHHAVIREGSTTSNIRVVFNASFKTSNGTSLNDHLHIGSKLQADLPAVILKWRLHRYVYIADIEKMYRQILVDPRDTDYQRIVWRASPSEPLRHFRLRTVTYGTAPAPYLALRVLQQLVADAGSKYPLACPILQSQIYVDDCVFGADTQDGARQARDELVALTQSAGFNLRKWASNCPALLSDLTSNDNDLTSHKILQVDDSLKVLGVLWTPSSDSFNFNIQSQQTVPSTKRAILSTIAKFFDPLGWVTPVVVMAKIFMQKLWRLNCTWDASLPPDIYTEWAAYYRQLVCLRQVSLPRWVEYGSHVNKCEMHGFADASSSAYAAVVYVRISDSAGRTRVSLFTAKSKVAPIKPVSIPRLELCAALLLSRLLKFVITSLDIKPMPIHCWTDSMIVLAWVSQSPSRWKTFIANRVTEIQANLPTANWHHVPTEDNPADCASRGMSADKLCSHAIWWHGPPWLEFDPVCWPRIRPSIDESLDLEARTSVPVHTMSPIRQWDLADRYSCWNKLLRVTAYILRFVSKTRPKVDLQTSLRSLLYIQSSDSQPMQSLHPAEIKCARVFWLRYVQQQIFPHELQCLQTSQPIPKSIALSSLNVYIDSDGLIRVGGRLQQSTLPEDSKHPIVIASHPLVKLLILSIHLRTLHGGSQLTLATLRQEFWLIRARPLIRLVLHRCLPCVRERAAPASELMGSLPAPRVTRTDRAFLHCGVDYAGPVLIRASAGRGFKSRKAYIALFICLATRAVHLELVSDYSTAAFLACFDRFCSRRGMPNTMYSDNGTNFQGADRELRQSFCAANRDPDVRNKLATDQISWIFLPPAAPHFGGLWEAGVRSTKYHLKRVIGTHTLTFEEFSTLLCQIEACLNSRPIAPLSDHADDYIILTPGHFLIGSAINTIPTPTLIDVRESRLSRWQLIRQMYESFWQAWSTDYLHTLQQRPKWRTVQNLAKPGRIVLLRDPRAPPCKWELGRITRCHPGPDGLTRVVTVKTARSEYRRPIAKLSFLPVDIENVEDDSEPRAGGNSAD